MGRMNVMGIDPGIKGGIVIVQWDYDEDSHAYSLKYSGEMPPYINGAPRVDYFADILAEYAPETIVIEKGGAGILPSANKLSFATGALFGISALSEAYVELVHPSRWQSKMLKGIEGNTTKDRARIAAEKWLPDLVQETKRGRHMDGISDAACISMWWILSDK